MEGKEKLNFRIHFSEGNLHPKGSNSDCNDSKLFSIAQIVPEMKKKMINKKLTIFYLIISNFQTYLP